MGNVVIGIVVIIVSALVVLVINQFYKILEDISKYTEETSRAVKQVLYPAIPFDQVEEVEKELELYRKRWYAYYWIKASKPETTLKSATLGRRLSAIRRIHDVAGHTSPITGTVREALSAAKRYKGSGKRRRSRLRTSGPLSAPST